MAKPTAAPSASEDIYTLMERIDDQEGRIHALTAVLAQKDKQHEAMLDFICEMSGRLFCYEMTHGMRTNARFDTSGIAFRYPGSVELYNVIHERTRKVLMGEQ